ncbi:MAG: DUF4276 family protein [Bacteroidota bacterium]
MAVIKIYIEGGVLPNASLAVQTINNSQRLRESFYKLLSQKVEPDRFELQVEIGGGFQNTIKLFRAEFEKDSNTHLLIDLDLPKSQRKKKIAAIELDDEIFYGKIFFMVQEMETWILSQPVKIEQCFAHLKRVRIKDTIENDNLIKDIHPEDITKPSAKLRVLLGRYFREERKGKLKRKKYKKLKDGADLLELLDINALEEVFEDIKAIVKTLQERD